MKKMLFILFAILHLAVIIYNNIITEEQALNQYFFNNSEPGTALRLLAKQPYCLEIFNFYSSYTGAETGYGLYAPNVSGDIIILFTSIDAYGRILSVTSPQLNSGEARIRFSNAAGMFMEKTGNPDKQRSQYLNVVLKSIAMWIQEHQPGCSRVFADLLVYHLPSALQVKTNHHPSYIKLGHYEYKF